MMKCSFKASIIGCGNVGVTAAYAMILNGIPTEVVLVSRDVEKAKGEKLDLDHCLPFLGNTKVVATDNYDDIAGSQFVVITAGAAQKDGETRLDLVNKNLAIIDDIIPKILHVAPEAVILIVSNPVDILTYRAIELAGEKTGRIFGSGTMLDTARFRFHLSEALRVNPRSIHTYILGEHGDSSFPTIASATVGGQPLLTFPTVTQEMVMEAFDKARNAAYEIIKAKGATYYAIGVVITKIMEGIFYDSKSVLPVSYVVDDYYGVSDVSLSVPCIIGHSGVSKVLKVELSDEEQTKLQKSAEVLKSHRQ